MFCEVPISFTQAALGAKIDVPTLDGKVKMKVPAGHPDREGVPPQGQGHPAPARPAARRPARARGGRDAHRADARKQRELLEKFAELSGEEHPPAVEELLRQGARAVRLGPPSGRGRPVAQREGPPAVLAEKSAPIASTSWRGCTEGARLLASGARMIHPFAEPPRRWVLAVLVLVGSIGVWLPEPHPGRGDRPPLGAATPRARRHAGPARLRGSGALHWAMRSWTPASAAPGRPSRSGRALSPLAVVDADVATAVREMLAGAAAGTCAAIVPRAEPDMIAFMDVAAGRGLRVGASDVHIHPLESGTRIAFRVHGVLEEVMMMPARAPPAPHQPPQGAGQGWSLYRIDKPQDGHFPFGQEGPADIRVSLLAHQPRRVRGAAHRPQQRAAAAALRARASRRAPASLPAAPRRCRRASSSWRAPPAAARRRRCTPRWATSSRRAASSTRIATIEDPVEYDVPLFAQTQVNAEQGFTFAQGLRSVLRQDPNVIMVGEIRDPETARTAIQAGLSGHLLLTTVHANSAAGVFNRLIEMGVEPFLLASASAASISQRLVRALCPHCRMPSARRPRRRSGWTRRACPPRHLLRAAAGCSAAAAAATSGAYRRLRDADRHAGHPDCINAKVPTRALQEIAVSGGHGAAARRGRGARARRGHDPARGLP